MHIFGQGFCQGLKYCLTYNVYIMFLKVITITCQTFFVDTNLNNVEVPYDKIMRKITATKTYCKTHVSGKDIVYQVSHAHICF